MQNAKTQATIGKIATDLEELTRQLNTFKLASVANVEDVQNQYSEYLNARLTLQSNKMDNIAESVEKQQKTTSKNAELLQNLLIGVQNLGGILRTFIRKWTTGVIQKSKQPMQNSEI